MKQLYLIVLVFLKVVNAEAQTATRVVAFAKFGADTTVPCTDSGGYKYSHGRGGSISYTPLPYIFSSYPFVFGTYTELETGHFGIVNCDTSWELSPTDTDYTIYLYDDQGNNIYTVCNKMNNGTWGKYCSWGFAFDLYNNLVQKTDSFFGNYPVTGVDIDNYSYNINGQLVQESDFSNGADSSWLTIDTKRYVYDNNGNLDVIYSTNLEENCINCSKYDTSYNIDSLIYNNGTPDSLISRVTTLHPLNSGGRIIRYYFSTSGDTMIANYFPYDSYIVSTTVYDYRRNPILQIHNILASDLTWDVSSKKEWTYNENNQVTCEMDYSKDSSGNWIFTNLIRYYYESYTPAAPFVINTINVFPSPASYSISIQLEWDKSQPFTIGMYDVAGRLVAHWNEPATQKFEQTFNVSNVAAGNYFFRATSGKQVLVKQFVVVH